MLRRAASEFQTFQSKSASSTLSVERWTLSNVRREFPEMAGLSALNLRRMRAFYLAYAASDQKLS
ncbi:MAG: hypothetical protein DMF26_19855 [Verrucomicrobia bacterium]|nr:MAG: hypothetical protein DMF26_19855 [Verrucomicrobiota bacterium]